MHYVSLPAGEIHTKSGGLENLKGRLQRLPERRAAHLHHAYFAAHRDYDRELKWLYYLRPLIVDATACAFYRSIVDVVASAITMRARASDDHFKHCRRRLTTISNPERRVGGKRRDEGGEKEEREEKRKQSCDQAFRKKSP